jgi:raffinose/stachyose/melibiose transport system substrate-binding protein
MAQRYADVEGSPNIIKGVQYNIEQLKPINDVIMSGDMFLTPINFWPPGMRSSWEQYLQQLFIDKDVDAFVASSENMIVEAYKALQ